MLGMDPYNFTQVVFLFVDGKPSCLSQDVICYFYSISMPWRAAKQVQKWVFLFFALLVDDEALHANLDLLG